MQGGALRYQWGLPTLGAKVAAGPNSGIPESNGDLGAANWGSGANFISGLD